MSNTFTIGGDLTVHRMGFGAMRITGDGIWGPPKDHDQAIRVLQRAVELGVDFIDTADSYGPKVSESLIAEALYPYSEGLVVATKGGLTRGGPNQWSPDGSAKHLRKALEGSLDRLKIDQIDLYQLHRIDTKVPFEETMSFLQDAQENGFIRHVGLSEVSIAEIQAAEKYVKIVSVQNKYSVDFRHWEAEVAYTAAHGIAFIPWYPLGGGNVDAIHVIRDIAKELEASPNQVALAWLYHHSPNILLIPGTSQVAHLEENLGAVHLHLNPNQLDRLNELGRAKA